MSEDQKRDPEGRRSDEESISSFSESAPQEDGADARAASGPDAGAPRRTERVKVPPPVDEDTIAKHRAAKEARIRKRMEERRAAAEAPDANGQAAPAAGKAGGRPGNQGSALPALRPNLQADTPALRAERVEAIRRDLVRRRRRKGSSMLFKLWLFVLLPTSLVAYFMWFKASELYKSETTFMVRSAEGGGGGGLLSMFGGGGSALYDPNAIYKFLLSRDVLRLLDKDEAWIAHFQNQDLDFMHGLEADASFEEAYAHYASMVEVAYDPSEGLVDMSMVAADPETAQRFSLAVISYSEEMINRLSERIQADSVRDAEANLVNAEERLRQAQEAVAELQKALDTFTVEGEVAAEMSIISGMEVELEALKGRLTNLRRVTGESDPRVERIRNQVATLEAQIIERRQNITGGGGADDTSLTDINLALTKARFEVEAATAIFGAAVERREIAVANARRQSRYLEVVSSPSIPDDANYPKKIETTALAFFAFLGLYIIGSLTISLIREQASI